VVRLARPSALAIQTPDWWQRAVMTLAAALVLLVPLVWHTGMMDVFRSPKSLLAGVVWALLALLAVVRNWRGPAWRDPWLLPFAGVVAGALLSGLGAPMPLRVVLDTVPFALAAVGIIAIRQITERQRSQLQRLIVYSGALQAALALFFLRPDFRPTSYAGLAGLEGRYAWLGTMGNPADVAQLIALPFLLAVVAALEKGRRRATNLIAAVLMAVALVGTQTLSVLAAVGLGISAIVLARVPRRRRLPLAAAGIVVVASLVAAIPSLRFRVVEAATFARYGLWTWMGSGRTAGFGAALGMLATHPVGGVGFGQFETESFHYQGEALLAERARALGLETGFGEAHSELLQHAGETGSLGLALAVAGIVLAWRWARRDGATLAARTPLLLTATAIALAQFPLRQATLAAQWAVLAALAVPALAAPPLPAGRRRTVSVVTLGLGAALVLTVAWVRGAAFLAVERGQVLVEMLRTTRQESRVTASRRALAELTARSRWLPYDWRAATVLGNLAMDAGDLLTARDHFTRAVALAERPENRFNLAMALLAAGDEARGFDELIRAVKLNPAVIKQLNAPEALEKLRDRLQVDGYLKRYPWIFGETP
jgi:O-antigen ligase